MKPAVGSPLAYYAARGEVSASSWSSYSTSVQRTRVVVEGMGDWGQRVYRPALSKARSTGVSVHALYRDVIPTLAAGELKPWERFETKRFPWHPPRGDHDLLIVSTPDETHAHILEASLGHCGVALVEKPFCTNCQDLARAERVVGHGMAIRGVDHYPFYIASAVAEAHKIRDWLGGAITRVDFALLQSRPIEARRMPSLSLGLTLDMLPHFLALLLAIGVRGSITGVRAYRAGQHAPLIAEPTNGKQDALPSFDAETCGEIGFLVSDPGAGGAIRCRAFVGKGMPIDAKYLDIFGARGRVVRLDLGSEFWHLPHYPRAMVSYVSVDDEAAFESPRPLGSLTGIEHVARGSSLDTARVYDRLLTQVLRGTLTPAVATCLFTPGECRWIVELLYLVQQELAAFLIAHKGAWPQHVIGELPGGWEPTVWN